MCVQSPVCPKRGVVYPARTRVRDDPECPKHRVSVLSLRTGVKKFAFWMAPKEMYIDPMRRTVKDAPDCPTAGVNYPGLRTVKSVQTFGGPTVVGSIRDFLSVTDGRLQSNQYTCERERVVRLSNDRVSGHVPKLCPQTDVHAHKRTCHSHTTLTRVLVVHSLTIHSRANSFTNW